MLRPTRARRIRRWGWRLAASLAFLAQCWIAVAPLSESRGFGLSAHVEALGNHRGHFTHDAANCPACTAMSLHVLSSHPPVVPVPPGQPVLRVVTTAKAWIAPVYGTQSHPRAPPPLS